jgi:hypothetical protein
LIARITEMRLTSKSFQPRPARAAIAGNLIGTQAFLSDGSGAVAVGLNDPVVTVVVEREQCAGLDRTADGGTHGSIFPGRTRRQGLAVGGGRL